MWGGENEKAFDFVLFGGIWSEYYFFSLKRVTFSYLLHNNRKDFQLQTSILYLGSDRFLVVSKGDISM